MNLGLVLRQYLAPLAWMSVALTLLSCKDDPEIPVLYDPIETSSSETSAIYVTSNGWHSGIVINKDDLIPPKIPEADDFPDAQFLEFGWGDAEFYPAEESTIGMTLSAALIPTEAVLHVSELKVSPVIRYPNDEVIPLLISTTRLQRLVEFIDFSFNRGDEERAKPTGPGLHAGSFFYPAKGRFHLFNTCNTWSARALVSAGFSIREKDTKSAEDLMRQVRLLGRAPNQ